MVSLIKTFIVVFLIFVSGSLFLRSLLYFWKEVLTFGSSEIKTLLIQNQLADSEHLFTKKASPQPTTTAVLGPRAGQFE
nr:unnamed protein product [Callosobruchus chinensis]